MMNWLRCALLISESSSRRVRPGLRTSALRSSGSWSSPVAPPNSPAVQQALHGYRDGHRILAASVSLEDADRRQMLTLSDSPDAKQIAPGVPLFNGYPLPSGEFFVLAMTWPASEIRRPGCVWTHSLWLPPDTLREPSLASLLGCFRRPQGEESFSGYSHELTPILDVGSPDWDSP